MIETIKVNGRELKVDTHMVTLKDCTFIEYGNYLSMDENKGNKQGKILYEAWIHILCLSRQNECWEAIKRMNFSDEELGMEIKTFYVVTYTQPIKTCDVKLNNCRTGELEEMKPNKEPEPFIEKHIGFYPKEIKEIYKMNEKEQIIDQILELSDTYTKEQLECWLIPSLKVYLLLLSR